MANILSPAKISSTKLLGGSVSTKKISADSIKKTKKNDDIFIIKTQVFKIRDLVKDSYLLKKAEAEKQRKLAEKQKFRKKEEGLEKKSEDEKGKIKTPEVPKLGFLDRIKNFIFNTLLGYVVVRLIPHISKLTQFVKMAAPAFDFIVDMSVGLFDGLVTFIDKGYEARDKTLQFIKKFGGDSAENMFKMFEGAIGKVIEAAIIIGMSAGDFGGDGGGFGGGRGRRGFDATGRRVGKEAQRRFAERFGREEFIKRFGKENLKNLPKSMQRGVVTKLARKGAVAALGKGGVKTAIKILKPLTKGIPVIGGLIEFGLALMEGDSVGKAAFKAVGATLFGGIGAALGGPFALFTGIGGSMLGSFAAEKLYDFIFSNKSSKQKVKGKAGGGITRGGKTQGSVRRRVSKKKAIRTVKPVPQKIKPGASVGGENKIEKLFPESTDKSTVNPLGYIENSYDTTSKIPFFGPIFSIAYKTLMGDKPDKVDYTNASHGLTSWMNRTFDPDIMRGGMAYAGGGEVNAEMFMKGQDLTNVIAKTVEESVSSKVDDAINNLQNQLALRELTPPTVKNDATLDTGDDVYDGEVTPGLWGPLLDLIAGKESGGNYEAMYPSTTLKGATKMTISEVARRATGAVGKYQQLPQYLVGRAKAAGLNPDRDLYSPENQDLIITKVNIKGRGGERWLKGEISDEQFMQGLSQEFASLPNAQGVFYYSGQRSAMTPQKIKQALSKVKSGGNIASSGPGISPGDLNIRGGKAFPLPKGRVGTGSGQVYGAPRSYGGHAGVDVVEQTPYGPNPSIPVVAYSSGRVLSEKYQTSGYTSGLMIGHGGLDTRYLHVTPTVKPGTRVQAGQVIGRLLNLGDQTHLHFEAYRGSQRLNPTSLLNSVAKFHGGLVMGEKMVRVHKGEYLMVFDKDTVDLMGKDILQSINAVENRSQLVSLLRSYASYELGSPIEVEVDNSQQSEASIIPIPIPLGMGSGSGFGSSEDPYESMAMSQ